MRRPTRVIVLVIRLLLDIQRLVLDLDTLCQTRLNRWCRRHHTVVMIAVRAVEIHNRRI